MKTGPPKISTKHSDNLDQFDLDEVDSEGVWLAADDEEIGEEEPEVTPESVLLYLPSKFKLQQRKDLG